MPNHEKQTQVATPLTDGEKLRFEQCRTLIRNHLTTCFEVGNALAEIRDNRYYREHWPSFDAFCKSEFTIGKAYAYRLIESVEVKQSVEESPAAANLKTEAQSRALSQVPDEFRTEVLEAAVALAESRGVDVTADGIRDAAKTIVPPKPAEPPKPVVELDSTGFEIPAKLVDFWNRRSEVQKLLTAVSLLRSTLRRAQEEDDLLFRPVVAASREQTWVALITALDRAYANIGLAVPYAVCPVCQGHLMKACNACQERGFVSEFFYKHQYDSDSRRVREAACHKPKDK